MEQPRGSKLDWLFRNRRTGRVTIGQAPNILLAVWVAATVLRSTLHPTGALRIGLNVIARGALVVWAVDEIARGVNPWRRALGFGVLVLLAVSWLRASRG